VEDLTKAAEEKDAEIQQFRAKVETLTNELKETRERIEVRVHRRLQTYVFYLNNVETLVARRMAHGERI